MSWPCRTEREIDFQDRRSLTIGLVNNASERAKPTTERQFRALLDSASPEITVELLSLTLTGAQNPSELSDMGLDGLVVTGMEPTARSLQDEPIWPGLTRLVDWAEDRSVPVLWSCLAAHAAVLYIDGIVRHRFAAKLSGVYDCTLVAPSHPLCARLPARWKSPHSRFNDVGEDELVAAGYDVLARTDGHGVDLFAKTCGGLFLFAQGHPEYDARSLTAEYRRDVRRYFFDGQQDYPAMCRNYFDANVETELERLRGEALRRRHDSSILAEILRVLDQGECPYPWRPPAQTLYRNWLHAVSRGELGRTCAWPADGARLAAMRDVASANTVLVS